MNHMIIVSSLFSSSLMKILFKLNIRDRLTRFKSLISSLSRKMNDFGYTVEVTGLSTKATEKDVYDFFAFSGTIEHVEIVRYLECWIVFNNFSLNLDCRNFLLVIYSLLKCWIVFNCVVIVILHSSYLLLLDGRHREIFIYSFIGWKQVWWICKYCLCDIQKCLFSGDCCLA